MSLPVRMEAPVRLDSVSVNRAILEPAVPLVGKNWFLHSICFVASKVEIKICSTAINSLCICSVKCHSLWFSGYLEGTLKSKSPCLY